jgi:electron transport complex protein RnfE
MADKSYAEITRDGLWTNNPALVQILGMCPVMAITSTMVNGIGLGIATMLTLTITNALISLIRNHVNAETRISVFMIIIASVVTAIELTMKAFFPDLYNVLGIFVALIVTNCIVLGRAEAFAVKNNVVRSALDGMTMGLGITCVLVVLSMMREVIGYGTFFAHANTMFGEAAGWLTVQLSTDYHGFLLAILPPGAFIGLGLLIAMKNVIDARVKGKSGVVVITAELPSGAQGAH